MSLDWPPELNRTAEAERERTAKFGVTLGSAISDIDSEMDRLSVDDWRLETAMPQRKTDRLPYTSAAEPEDPGVVLRWIKDGDQYAVGCDRYDRVRDNMRALGLYLMEKRKMETRPIATVESEFATARLPPGDEESEAVVARKPPHEVLGVAPDPSESEVQDAFRALVKVTHPDLGGREKEFAKIKRAREKILNEANP